MQGGCSFAGDGGLRGEGSKDVGLGKYVLMAELAVSGAGAVWGSTNINT